MTYGSRKEWWSSKDARHKALYQFAVRRRILDECCTHMIDLRRRDTTLADCQASARKYRSRCTWQQSEDNGLYQIALRRRWLQECCGHMSPLNSDGLTFAAYACVFPDLAAYVGITRNARYRKMQHTSRGKVRDHARETGLDFEFLVLESELLPSAAVAREDYWMNQYSRSHTLLNTAKAGSLGGFVKRNEFSFAECQVSAKQFLYRIDWKNGDARKYRRALKMGWLDSCAEHMPRHMPMTVARARARARRGATPPTACPWCG